MQNKGAIRLLAIAFAIVCIFQLSFTVMTLRFEKSAKEAAKKNPKTTVEKELDKKVYNLLVKKYTYKECKEQQINLGLDLQGGMDVTLEVDVEGVIRSLAGINSNDTSLVKALEVAKENHKTSNKDFVTDFGDAFKQVNPNGKLANIYSTGEISKKYKYNATNAEVLSAITKEVDDAIDNSFNILRSRIDKFGVIQPNIQKLATKGRISLQLPGIKEPERVRKLLQGTANLEFWGTYENSQIFPVLQSVNKLIAEMQAGKVVKKDSVTGKMDTVQATTNSNPLFDVLNPSIALNERKEQVLANGSVIGTAAPNDIDTINYYLGLRQVKALFQSKGMGDVKFIWSLKPEKGNQSQKERYQLHAISTKKNNGRPLLDGSVITDAQKEFEQNSANAHVSMSMNAEGAQKWAGITGDNIGKCIAIVLDGSVVSSPTVQNKITGGNSQITGNFTVNEANDLAIILKSGKVPAPAHIIEENTVGPTLGKEAINAGMISFIMAFIGVLLYMWLYYGKAGNVANIALFANVFFLFGVFASMGLVLTLPGIAGIVLTLAMAVDGNVIIYERMREEVRAGKAPKNVVKDGFWHAYSAIIDGHVTTILTGVVLFLFGSGPVQGFATSLIVGLLLSLFSSIFITRLVFESMLNRGVEITLGNKFTINAMTKAKIDFIGLRKIMYVASGIVILICIISLFVRKLDPSVEFTGGRTYVVRFDQSVTTQDIRDGLTKVLGIAPEVKTFGTDDQVKITTNFKIDDKSTHADSLVTSKLYDGVKGFYKKPISFSEFSAQTTHKTLGALSSHRVDPVISSKLIRDAFLAVFFGLVIIFIYIAIRFRNWKYGLGGVISLAHDTMITIGMFSLLHGILPFSLEIGQDFIAALLTIIGYSIMDTVIIYDRIREYKKLYPARALDVNINDAINHTLGRTINTSGITIVVLVIIFIFGGEILRGFIFALLVGVLTGTYSSVFNATPVAYDIIRLTEKKKKK